MTRLLYPISLSYLEEKRQKEVVQLVYIWVLPGHKLDKGLRELNSGLCVKDGGPLVSDEVS